MEVSREAYPDPTSVDPQWFTCDFAPMKTFAHPLILAEIRSDPDLSHLPLIKQPRLAVMPIDPEHFTKILTKTNRKGYSD